MTRTQNTKTKFSTLNYRGLSVRYGTRSGKSKNTPLLMFNGIGQSIEVLDPLMDALDTQDIIVFDIPGTGKSDTPLLPWRFRHFAKLAAAVLDKLAYKEVNVLGFSWGGTLAQTFAYQYPTLCKKLVLAAAPPGQLMVPGNPMVYLRMASAQRFWNKDYMRSIAGSIYGGSIRDCLDIVDQNAQRLIPPSMRGYFYQGMCMHGTANLLWLRNLKQQTLILHGKDDPMIPAINAKAMKMLIPNSRLEFIECGHMFMLTKLKEVSPKIEAFLAT